MPPNACAQDPLHFGTLGRAILSVFQLMTQDSWEQIYLAATLGCDHAAYPFTDRSFNNQNTQCKHPDALGWVAIAVLIPLTLVVGYVLPTLLIGVVSIKFEGTMARLVSKSTAKSSMELVINRLKVCSCFLNYNLDRSSAQCFQKNICSCRMSFQLIPFLVCVQFAGEKCFILHPPTSEEHSKPLLCARLHRHGLSK